MAKPDPFVDKTRSAVRRLMDVIEDLEGYGSEYTTLGAASWADLDLVEFDDTTKADFVAVWSALAAIRTALDTGDNRKKLYEVAG